VKPDRQQLAPGSGISPSLRIGSVSTGSVTSPSLRVGSVPPGQSRWFSLIRFAHLFRVPIGSLPIWFAPNRVVLAGRAVVYAASQPEWVAVNEILVEPREEPA
jgi:NADP-dependent 3-hydroxy acid dehydrogenase YdfG